MPQKGLLEIVGASSWITATPVTGKYSSRLAISVIRHLLELCACKLQSKFLDRGPFLINISYSTDFPKLLREPLCDRWLNGPLVSLN